MRIAYDHPILFVLCAIVSIVIILIVSQLLLIRFNGSAVPAPEIPREALVIGQGDNLEYVVLGDSTSIGQGANYENSIAIGTANHLAKSSQVTMHNYGKSGAVIHQVATEQLPNITTEPDVVIVAVGANDVTHLTNISDMEKDANYIVDELRKMNPDVAIVFTGSPDMGSVPRLPQPTRWLAGKRTQSINQMFDNVAVNKGITRAQLAEKTGPIFARTPSFFAADNFHPADNGYEIWIPVLNDALDKAIDQV